MGSAEGIRTPVWVRAVADPRFRLALIEDPLGALAAAGDVEASPAQLAQLEEMDRDAREQFVNGVVIEVHVRGGQARFGWLKADGRLGGPD